MPATPEVTVVIPTKDRWETLARTLGGVLAQEDVELEAVVVDDGSSDGTSDRLGQLADPRVRSLRNDPGLGVSGARNRGLEHARGRWTAFLDDDDLWSPRKLREQLDAAAEADANVVYSSALVVDASYRPLDVNPAPPAGEVRKQILRMMAIPGGGSNLIAETALIRDCGGFDRSLYNSEDWDLWTRLILAGRPADVQALHIGYVVHEGNKSVTQADRYLEEFEYIERKHADARRREGVELDRLMMNRWLAGSYRQGGQPGRAVRVYLQGARAHRSAGNVARAAGTAIGEPVMRVARRFADARRSGVAEPPWLELYRPGGRLHQLPRTALK
jgi:glycosyltransferase involved in cell wall biosynthesis